MGLGFLRLESWVESKAFGVLGFLGLEDLTHSVLGFRIGFLRVFQVSVDYRCSKQCRILRVTGLRSLI